MRHSLRLRLLLILVAVPVAALAAVAFVARFASDSHIESRLQFDIQPVTTGQIEPAGVSFEPVPGFRTEIDLNVSNHTVLFDTGTGQAYTIQAGEGFLEAYEQDREGTISAINRQVTVAALVAALIAVVMAFLLSSRIVQPVQRLTSAARRLESGDLSQRVPVGSEDELGKLAGAFNAMAASIEHSQDLRRQMTSDVAHELRTPLNNIAGYLDAIADGVVEPDEAVIGSLQEEASLLVRLVADLEQLSLADAGRQVLHRETVQLPDIVQRAVSVVMPRARSRGVTIETRLGNLRPVEGDAGRLGQIIRNLLENAVTHTPKGGVINVSLDENDGAARLQVRDTGPGVDAEHLPFIFERFYRADPSRTRATGGAGLGLAIVKQLVEAHGGTVTAENAPSGGAVFTVVLPVIAVVPGAFGIQPVRIVPRPS